jgi:hypothetical protein
VKGVPGITAGSGAVAVDPGRAGPGQRARIVLLAGDGIGTDEIARRAGCPSRR